MQAQPIPLAEYADGGHHRSLELVDLVPPFALSGGLWACQRFRDLIAAGTIQRTRTGILTWIADARERETTRNRRQTMFDQARDLLNGRRLEEAETCFTAAYADHVRHDPGVAATRIVLHGLKQRVGSVRILLLSDLVREPALNALEWEMTSD